MRDRSQLFTENLSGREDQLVFSFVAVFSFGMGVMVAPALLLSSSSDIDQEWRRQGEHGEMAEDVSRQRLSRLIQLEAVLLRAHVERPEIAMMFGLSMDTVKRDIQTLVSIGSDAKYSSKRGWRATRAVFVANVPLEPQEPQEPQEPATGDSNRG